MAVIPGIRGSGNWETDQKVGSFREGILLLEPNGDAPLFALTSKLKEKQIDDTTHSWFKKAIAQDTATVTDVYENAALSDAYDAGDDYPAGSVVYLKMTASAIADFVVGNVVRMHAAGGDSVLTPIHGRVERRVNAGSNSYLAVKLLQSDGAGTGDLSVCDRVSIVSSAYAEGAEMPNSLSYNPEKVSNYTQIFRRSLRQTRTSLRIRLRTGDQYQESKRETLQYHNMDIERALFFGVPTDGVDDTTGQRIGTMGGLEHFIKTYAPSNIFDYTTDTNFAGKTWTEGGEDWLDSAVEQLFRYGTSMTKLVYCGPGFLTGINRIAKRAGVFELSTDTIGYGIKVKRYETAHGDLMLARHPMFTKYPEWNNGGFVLEVKNITYCYIDDTTFVTDANRDSLKGGGRIVRAAPGIDGLQEEFLTECTLEVAFPEMFGILKGVNLDNTL